MLSGDCDWTENFSRRMSSANEGSVTLLLKGPGDGDGPDKIVYRFLAISNKKYAGLENKDICNFLTKWSMNNLLKVNTFSFVGQFRDGLATKFVTDFFLSPASVQLLSAFPGQPQINGVNQLIYEVSPVTCEATNLKIFDTLLNPENGIVRGTGGHINKCEEENVNGILVADELRKMLVGGESEYLDLIPKKTQDEFIYRLFSHLAIGGQWCQYEDSIQPYIDTTRAIYKDLISLIRIEETNELKIVSKVIKVGVRNEEGCDVLPPNASNPQNFIYFIVDPAKRELITLTHYFGGIFPTVN